MYIFIFICICVFCHSIAFSCKKSLSKWVVRLGYFLAKSNVYTDTSIKQAIDVIKLNLILLLLKEHRQENRPFRHIERTTIIDEIASSKRPPSANRRKTKKSFHSFFHSRNQGLLVKKLRNKEKVTAWKMARWLSGVLAKLPCLESATALCLLS